ncbi:CAP domain-containing protein [Streptomyces sp. NPDC051921]|uniref:CAP domain-containing protein n=1 Tax=Streptomyces sp. NPDC051921 TaxID=3155806 RepID=UPI003423B87A
MQHDAYDAALPLEGPERLRTPRAAHGGRHRRKAARRVPSFRTATITAGTIAAALTVVTGLYAAPGAPSGGPPRSAPPPLARADTVAAARPVSLPERAAGTVAPYATQVVALANAERRRAGCPPLRSDARLREAAQRHADDMAARVSYAHVGKDGRDAGDRISTAGYDWSSWGENIHRGPESPAQAVEDWMNSPGHRKNILNCAFQDIGVGVNLRANGPWWVQDFATGR